MKRPHSRHALVGVPIIVIASFALAGCNSTAPQAGGNFDYLAITEDQVRPDILDTLADGECATEEVQAPVQGESLPLADLDTRLQLLAGQDALPTIFASGGTPELVKDLAASGALVDFESTLDEMGLLDNVSPGAIATIKSIYGEFNTLPLEFAIEGFWYNEAVFEDLSIEVPTTWDDLLDVAAELQSAGVQPFATGAAGQGWPVTRLISGYIQRDVGPQAFEAVRDAHAALTDPEYVSGAQAIADLGEAGYLGDAVEAVDYNGILQQFLSGDAAIMYMGSWVLSDFNAAEPGQLSSDDVGFFPFPEVEGGSGTLSELPANVGVPWAMSTSKFNASAKDWLKCIVENWGTVALDTEGTISGFTVNGEVDVDELTADVQSKVETLEQGLVWFETYFGPRASDVAWTNVAALVNGQMSAEEYMALVQDALDTE